MEIHTQFAGLSHNEIMQLDRDYGKVARTIRLSYVNDSMPGIVRVRKGRGFAYLDSSKKLIKSSQLERIRKLAIPPAWTNVWICAKDNGHIQATGYDLRKRKQYRYHELWNAARNETKFHRVYEFGKALPVLRARLQDDLKKKTLCREKVLATVISVIERTSIRIGNEDYEKLYGSYGMTTLKDGHVKIEGSEVRFSFTGKKNIAHTIALKSKKLARIVKQCRDIPGKELFQYYDDQGMRHSIDSGMVNDYIKETLHADFTAKDFRTWAGSLNMLHCLKTLGESNSEAECKRNILSALDYVSQKLGNTRNVCRKYYVHPQLINFYETKSLMKYLHALPEAESEPDAAGLGPDEKVLMKVLKSIQV
jgi:DNA topoisomerase-1